MKAENGQNIQKNITIGAGNFGTVWSVVNDDTIVIKEQTATCYTFINEIECLDILKNTGIIPQLKNAYVCFNKKSCFYSFKLKALLVFMFTFVCLHINSLTYLVIVVNYCLFMPYFKIKIKNNYS